MVTQEGGASLKSTVFTEQKVLNVACCCACMKTRQQLIFMSFYCLIEYGNDIHFLIARMLSHKSCDPRSYT